jgi:hypothetical protein
LAITGFRFPRTVEGIEVLPSGRQKEINPDAARFLYTDSGGRGQYATRRRAAEALLVVDF